MSGFLRRSPCSSCLRYRLVSSFSSKSVITRPLSAASQEATSIRSDGAHGESLVSKTVRASRKKRTVGSSAKRPPHATPKEPHRNLLKETKLQEYLDHIASTNQEVTLADVERYRPSQYASPHSPEYEEEYTTLVETLVRSFSLNQLRKFLDMYHLSAPPRRNKWEIAVAIIERQWNWPSLTIIKKEKRDWTEVIHESFSLDARQAFLILGKDGADLLALSTEFNAHVSFSANPLSLKVEGLRGSLSNLSRYIEDFKAGIKEQLFQLPPGESLEQESLQRISRMSGVFVEDMGHGLIRISYRREDDRAAHYAKYLTMRSATDVTQEIPTLVYSRHSSSISTTQQSLLPHRTYALYPFLSSRSEPSTINLVSLFRIRRVGDWLRSSLSEDSQNTGGLVEEGVPLNLYGEPVDLRHTLLSQVAAMSSNTSDSRSQISASFGHLLVSSDSSQRLSITPPLRGTPELPAILGWLRSQTTGSLFIPSLPPQRINSPPAQQQRLIHRLVYYSFPINQNQATKFLEFELILELLDPSASNKAEESDQKSSLVLGDDSRVFYPVDRGLALEPKCWTGSFEHLNLMLPDRPMDVRLSVSTNSILREEKWPRDLQNYSKELRSFLTVSPEAVQPEIPSIVALKGTKYRLESSSTVRQSLDRIANTPLFSGSSLQAVTESIVELGSNQRSRLCKVTCDNIASDDSWISFLKYCDALTAPVPLVHNRVQGVDLV